MADVKLNPVLERISGKVGDLVFRRYEDQVILSRSPNREGLVPTAGQLAQRQNFRLAAIYGKTVFADPVQKAVYTHAAKSKGKPAFSLTIADFCNAPVVDEIDLSGYTGQAGETIKVSASDDFEVVGVAVAIRNANGAILEQGAATLDNGSWAYRTMKTLPPDQSVSIEVTASDRPGNKTVKTQARA